MSNRVVIEEKKMWKPKTKALNNENSIAEQNALHESQGSYLKRVTQSHWALLQYSGPKRNKH